MIKRPGAFAQPPRSNAPATASSKFARAAPKKTSVVDYCARTTTRSARASADNFCLRAVHPHKPFLVRACAASKRSGLALIINADVAHLANDFAGMEKSS
jgi:hypothetical protein